MFGDQRRAYFFSVNPLGIQSDGMQSEGRSMPDNSPDYMWYSSGHVTGSGWTVELRIPFTSIRFPRTAEGGVAIGINIIRQYGKTGEADSWAPRRRGSPCDICQQGQLKGIRAIHERRTVDLRPYTATNREESRQFESAVVPVGGTSYEALRPLGLSQGPFTGRVGTDVRFAVTSAYNVNATLNPDFSQVESDEGQVTLNQRYALFYRERRPFFVEGGDAFDQQRQEEDRSSGPGSMFYSRAIVDPAAGVRVTGKSGPWTSAVLYARDRRPASFWFAGTDASGIDTALSGSADALVTRVKRDVLSNSYVGVISTVRQQGEQRNGVFGFDANLRSGSYTLYLDAGRSEYRGALLTAAPDSTGQCPADYARDSSTAGSPCTHFVHNGADLSGHYYLARLTRTGTHVSFGARTFEVSPGYRNQLGLLQRSGIDGYSGYFSLTQYPTTGLVQRITESINVSRTLRYQGGGLDYSVQPAVEIAGPRQTYLWLGPSFDQIRILGTPINLVRLSYFLYTTPLRWLDVFAFGRAGQLEIYDPANPRAGNGVSTYTNLTFKPTDRASLQVGTTKVTHLEKGSRTEVDDATIFRLTGAYQFTRTLGLRLIGQSSNQRSALVANPFYHEMVTAGSGVLVSYEIGPTSFLYVGYNSAWQDFYAPLVQRDQRVQTGALTFFKLSYLLRM